MSISEYIAELLKYNECVVIPEFGAFISNYKPAQFDQKKNTFLPPSKEVVFNSKIKSNDGLLINHLVEVDKITYHNAEIAVLNFVDRINAKLDNGESVEFEKLGTFQFDKSGVLLFNPISSFELIEAYGLSEFSFTSLNQKQQVFQPRPAIRVLNRKRDFVKIAASVALLLALSIYPVKHNLKTLESSVIDPRELLSSNSAEELKVEEETIFEDKISFDTSKQEIVSSDFQYIIVGGSFGNYNNAIQLQKSLINEGYNSEIKELDNGLYRVIIDSYSNKKEAVNALTTYRQNHIDSKAWVGQNK